MPFLSPNTISECFLQRVRISPDLVGFQFKPTDHDQYPAETLSKTGWKHVNFKSYYDECRLVSFGLIGSGMKAGDRVAIVSNTRYEWSLCDMAILGASCVTVPVYASNTPDDVAYILEHSESRIAIIEDAIQLKKILDKKAENPALMPHLEKIVVMDRAAMALAGRAEEGKGFSPKNILTLNALKELGKREDAKDPTRFDQNLTSAKPDDLITICYTSGTTGVPKGVMLTHTNLVSCIEDCVNALRKHLHSEKEVVLSFLPFSHIFGKCESLAVYTFGWRQVFAESIDKLMANMAEIQPTLLFSVPRIFEKAYNKISAMTEGSSPVKKKLFQWAMAAGRDYYQYVWKKQTPPLKSLLVYQAAKQVVFKKISSRFGGNLRFAISGGAPLAKEIGEFFQIVGIQILEGYGLTETSAAVTMSTPEHIQFGTVGRPLQDVTFKLGEDGELWIRSKKIFKAYYKRPEETAQVLQDGWFKTGDVGYIDSEGLIHITDRIKDLIVTSGGKNIAPQKIENIAKAQSWIAQFVAHGDLRNFLTALVVLDREQVIQYANSQQILFSEYKELIKNPQILTLVQKIIDEVNTQLAHYETIKKFVILPNEFTIESGELTPSLKIRRNVVNKRYKAELDSMYVESGSGDGKDG